jgi:hypothetical protein
MSTAWRVVKPIGVTPLPALTVLGLSRLVSDRGLELRVRMGFDTDRARLIRIGGRGLEERIGSIAHTEA